MNPALIGAPRLRFNPQTVNVHCDGNSLTAGIGNPSAPYPSMLACMDPLRGVITPTNTGVSGNTTQQMTAAARPDPYWVAGKTNILIAWEGTNSLLPTGGNRTPQQAVADMQTYIAARLAVHPWLVVLVNCLPRQQSSEAASITMNANINAYNALLAAKYRSMGARVLVDLQQTGSPFAMQSYTDQAFSDAFATGLWAPTESPHVHLSGYGYAKVAKMIADGLKRLPIR